MPHARVSMQYTLAEALYAGWLGKDAYRPAALANPHLLRIADLVEIEPDPSFPGPEPFKGAVRIVLNDGTVHEAIEAHNRGSVENPMTSEEIIGKFDENAADVLDRAPRRRLVDAVVHLDSLGPFSRGGSDPPVTAYSRRRSC